MKYGVNLGSINDISAHVLELDILLEEVEAAVHKLKPNTSPGPDGLTPECIKWLFETCPNVLLSFARNFLISTDEEKTFLMS